MGLSGISDFAIDIPLDELFDNPLHCLALLCGKTFQAIL